MQDDKQKISRERERNRILKAMLDVSRQENFALFWAGQFLQECETIQQAYNNADLHDAVASAELKGELRALNRVRRWFENVETDLANSNAALEREAKTKRPSGPLRGAIFPQ